MLEKVDGWTTGEFLKNFLLWTTNRYIYALKHERKMGS